MKIEFLNNKELKKELSKQAITNSLRPTVVTALRTLEDDLQKAINFEYRLSSKLQKDLTARKVTIDNNQISVSLEYDNKFRRLAEFYTDGFQGNINPDTSKPGPVSIVTIRKNNPRIVTGKKHFGGFYQPRGKNVKVAQIFERLTEATWLAKGVRAPFRPLFTLSLADMALKVYNSASFEKTKDKLVEKISKFLI